MLKQIVSEKLNGQDVLLIKYTNELGEDSYSDMTFPTLDAANEYLRNGDVSTIEVIDVVIIGDDIYKVIREGDSAYIEYNGNLLSYFAGIDNAQHVFNRITLEAAEAAETTIGGPGVSIPLNEITF